MGDARDIDPKHDEVRGLLRVVGPLVSALGIMLIVIGFASLLSSMGTFEPPRFFWCSFVGIPVLFLGLVMTVPAYMGVVGRYVSAEAAPVQKDTFNYLSEGTSEGVRRLAEAAGEGFSTGVAGQEAARGVICPKCETLNPPGAQHCSRCGAGLVPKTCPRCRERNVAHARFCNQCGAQLA
jgi:ribosomal protein L40E